MLGITTVKYFLGVHVCNHRFVAYVLKCINVIYSHYIYIQYIYIPYIYIIYIYHIYIYVHIYIYIYISYIYICTYDIYIYMYISYIYTYHISFTVTPHSADRSNTHLHCRVAASEGSPRKCGASCRTWRWWCWECVRCCVWRCVWWYHVMCIETSYIHIWYVYI